MDEKRSVKLFCSAIYVEYLSSFARSNVSLKYIMCNMYFNIV